MTKYLLDDRERNGYDDSDFYAIFFNDETNKIESAEYGSTRFPSPHRAPISEYEYDVPQAIRQQAIAALEAWTFEQMKARDIRTCDDPQDANRGDVLVTLTGGTFNDKRTGDKVSYAAGEIGQVIWSGAFGKFYRNGYNKINRSTLRVGLKFYDGRVVFIGLKDCKTDKQYADENDLREMAHQYAQRENYAVMFSTGMIQL